MEFLKTIKRRSFIHEVTYIALNIGLALALWAVIRFTGSLWFAFAIVLLGKWRIFAVRPRFWWANIQSNLVSIIVSMSFVVLLYVTNISNIDDAQILITQGVLVFLDLVWLLWLKPHSKRVYVVAQAGVALTIGMTAIYSIMHGWIATPILILVWILGYVVAKHALNSYDDENHIVFLSTVWALALVEIGWLAYHWTIAYQMPIINGLLLPQVSIVVLGFGFLSYKIYDSYYHHQKVRINDIMLPLIFTIGIVAVLVLAFNGVSTSTV